MILWRYGNSIYGFLITLVGIASVFVFLIAQPTPQENPTKLTMPLEIFGFTYYQLSGKDTSLKVQAEHAFRLITDEAEGAKEYVLALQATQKKSSDTKELERLKADLMIANRQELLFPSGINYWRGETFFWSEEGIYETAERFFKGNGQFLIQPTPHDVIYGISLSYDYTLGLAQASTIQAFLEEHQK